MVIKLKQSGFLVKENKLLLLLCVCYVVFKKEYKQIAHQDNMSVSCIPR